MPIVRLSSNVDLDRPIASRVALFGPPATFKTTAIVQSWPRKFGDRDKLVIFSLPGEKGWETIPRNESDIIPLIWEIEDPAKARPHQVIKEVEEAAAKVAAGEYGKAATLALDGAHKLYPWYFQRAFLDRVANPPPNWDGDEEKLVGPSYGIAHREYGLFMSKILASTIPYIVVTFWESMEKDDPQNKSRDAKRFAYPDLPGQMARNAVGEFSACLFCEATAANIKGEARGYWLTRPEGRVKGACIKVPHEIGRKIPTRIPQHFEVLQRYMVGDDKGAAELARKVQPPPVMVNPDSASQRQS